MQPSIFVISLPGSVDRQQAIAQQLAQHGLDFSWLDGVDGRRLAAPELATVYSAQRAETEGGRQLNAGEIGCALSHQKVYRQMLAADIPLALVLEDDAALDGDFAQRLAEICATLDWQAVDLLLLSHIQKYTAWGARAIAGDRELVRPVVAYNGNGYLLTRRAAQLLLAQLTPIYQPADCWNHLREQRVLTIRGIVPYLVNHSRLSEDSLIGETMRAAPAAPVLQRSWLKLLKRLVYDKFLYQLVVKPLLRIRRQPVRW
jgi:glycosyl transferase family 25